MVTSPLKLMVMFCGMLAAQWGATAEARLQQPIVAVFDIVNEGAALEPTVLGRLSNYLASSLAATGAYQVVPRDKLKRRLVAQKKDSYKQCYDRSCQIEIGRELAAQKTLSTTIVKLGAKCKVTMVFYDLRTAASEGGARRGGGCSEDAIVAMIEGIVSSLVKKKSTSTQPVAKAPPQPPVDAAPPLSKEEAEYEQGHIGFGEQTTFGVKRGTLSGRWGSPYLGSEARPLDAETFFKVVGRNDYANYHRRRMALKRWIGIPGWVLLLGGTAVAVAGATGFPEGKCIAQDAFGECTDHEAGAAPALLWSGVATGAIGLAAVIVAAFISPHPATAEQVYGLAAEHNRKLRHSLGLGDGTDEDLPPQYQHQKSAASIGIAPLATGSSGGVVLMGTF
jgi:hypothetical protein